ncbi:unnamed protein product [Orchesella dallaii]|uniref:Elongation of very long chain fatty acids protein n=1 Tax=Orchesella dallaii TaxID=48710 RepID=A0ABP1QGR5_9HEXA
MELDAVSHLRLHQKDNLLSNNGMEVITLPNYTTAFEFEWKFDHIESQQWMEENWTSAFYYIGAYMAIIFLGQSWMKDRPRFELRVPLVIWNFSLAAFSILGTYRTLPEIFHILNRKNGFHHSVCFPSYGHNQVWAFYAYAFVLSKVPELGDTIFIVLRKQPLIFLHWYHHITVLLYSWYSYSEYIAPARWYIVSNFLVHSFMYTYYGLKACRVRIYKPIAVMITSLQLVQMCIGVIVNVHAYQAKQSGLACDVSDRNINLCLIMYSSYFILFARFFYKAYLHKKPFDHKEKMSQRKLQ